MKDDKFDFIYDADIYDIICACVISLCLMSVFFLFVGCSIAYKPDVHDSTINHQSDNTIKPSTDVNLDLGGNK